MVSSTDQNQFIYDVKLSSVVPATITGDDRVHALKDVDLVMKLHYIKGVYFFTKDATEGLDIRDMKSPMFRFLELYFPLAGRIRRPEDGPACRPFIKCNDSGVRIVEAKCSKTINEWLQLWAGAPDHDNQLVYNQVLGPDLGFSPLVFFQFTWFKCGGISIGLSWAHILGDAYSASNFINMWGQIMDGHQLAPKHISLPDHNSIFKSHLSSAPKIPFSIKIVDPVGDHWLISNHSKMQIHSLNFTAKQLNHLLSKFCGGLKVKPFEIVSALLWKSLAKIRGDQLEPKIVTICRNDTSCDRKNELLCNSQVIITVEAANVKVAEADLIELTNLIIAQKGVDERSMIEELMERDEGKSDFIVYGGTLTFVDLEDANIYGVELRGQKPVFANYTLSGVGDEGAVLVLPYGPASGKEQFGRRVNLILPENQIAELKDELRKEWGIF